MFGWILLGVVVLGYAGYTFSQYRLQKKAVVTLEEADFVAGYRKGQLIDVRNPQEYKAGHILGARNIPMGQMKLYMKGFNKNQPIYLYCQSQIRSTRAAIMLYKAGFRNLYQLKNGYKEWTGKIKK